MLTLMSAHQIPKFAEIGPARIMAAYGVVTQQPRIPSELGISTWLQAAEWEACDA